MEALKRFKKKLEDLAWNEMLYRVDSIEFEVEYKIVYCGNGIYIVRKYRYGQYKTSWLFKASKLRPPDYMIHGVLKALDEFKPMLVPIT